MFVRVSRSGRCPESCHGGLDEDSGAVDDCQLGVSGGETAPLLALAEASFDDVPALVAFGVEASRSSAAGSSALPVADLVGRLGVTALTPRSRRCRRFARDEYDLSPRAASSLFLGLPTGLAADRRSISVISMGESPDCPGETAMTNGNPVPSTSAWGLADRMPRERPIAWSIGSTPGSL